MRLIGNRYFEVGICIAIVFLLDVVNATSNLIEFARMGVPGEPWEPFVWEFTSGLVILMLIPAILRLDHRFPLTINKWKQHIWVHLAATVPFSIVHVTGMVWLRKAIYAAGGGSYDFGNLPIEMVYEYRKDAVGYVLILTLIYGYRFLRARLEGEAQTESGTAPSRFVVRQAGREHVVPFADVLWVEAAGNYALLHTAGPTYALRDTMAGLGERLSDHGFVRTHRSAIVNLAAIREIEPRPTGDSRLWLTSGERVRLSRRFRQTVTEGLAETG